MSRIPIPTLCLTAVLLLLCSCGRPVPAGAYRVETEKVSSRAASITRNYVIETSSLRKFILEETSGSNSVSIAPNSMTHERTGRAEASVTVELREPGEQAHATVKMAVKTDSATARAEETLAVPGATTLSSVLTEDEPTGDSTAATTLLRLASGDKFLQVVIR